MICTNKQSSFHDLYMRTLAGTNGSIQKGSPRNSPLHSVRAGEDHIHKGENFHPRVVNCVSACTTITDKILTLSFFLLFFQQFWSWSCTASTTTQCLILSDLISFSNFGHQSDIYLPKWWVELSSSSRETIDFFLLQFKKKFMITLDSSQSSIWAVESLLVYRASK